MSVIFIWEEKYCVGNPDIDEQHKKIFKIANSLTDDMSEQYIKIILMELFNFTREHFSDEEKMMKEIGYPKIDKQRQLHDELITKLSKMSVKSFDTSQSVLGFKKFIYDWIIDHILIHDMDYFYYNQERLANNS